MSVQLTRSYNRINMCYLLDVSLQNSGGDVHFSDRSITVSGTLYEPYIETVGGMSNEARMWDSRFLNSDLTFTFKNIPFRTYDKLIQLSDDYPLEGSQITCYEQYMTDDGAPSERFTLFKGYLEEPANITLGRFEIRATNTLYYRDYQWR